MPEVVISSLWGHSSATASTGSESQLHSLVLLWLLFGPAEWHFLLPLVDFVPMTGVYLPADQATMRVYTSREPEDPEFTVDSILPFLGLGATECDLNHYVLPMQTSVQTYVCPALESAESKWIPWDTTLDDTFRLHLIVCERELFISICFPYPQLDDQPWWRPSRQQALDLRVAALLAPDRDRRGHWTHA